MAVLFPLFAVEWIHPGALTRCLLREVVMPKRVASAFWFFLLGYTGQALAQAPECAQRGFGAPGAQAGAAAQQGGRDPGQPAEAPRVPQGTANVHVLSHVPLP